MVNGSIINTVNKLILNNKIMEENELMKRYITVVIYTIVVIGITSLFWGIVLKNKPTEIQNKTQIEYVYADEDIYQ